MYNNIILNTDSYKLSMPDQYPPNTKFIFSYIESRGGKYDKTVFFGLQAYIKEYLTRPITQADIDEAELILTAHGEPFYREGWQYILDEHKGYLPIKIKAVGEGYVVPVKNVLATIVNTDSKCFWLTTHIETSLLRAVWYGTTVATQSWYIKQLIKKYLEKTGDVSSLEFKLHDFGARGVSSVESAGIGGAAHLINFKGTDTISALLFAKKYYNADMVGFSIPAAEHSTITSWGRYGEVSAYRNMLDKFAKPGSILAVVSDSYDIYKAVENIWGDELKQQIIDSGATLVIRPDSGYPVEVICGEYCRYKPLSNSDELNDFITDAEDDDRFQYNDKFYMVTGKEDFVNEYGFDRLFRSVIDIDYLMNDCAYIREINVVNIPAAKGIINLLADAFGYTVNAKGYKVLNNVRVIQGDGINYDTIEEILKTLESMGYSADNIAFGMGGALLQGINRDTQKFAMKCSAAMINDEWRNVFKDPITDKGKTSKTGLLTLWYKDGQYISGQYISDSFGQDDLSPAYEVLETVFLNGKLLYEHDFEEIRENSNK